eukprot:CAMPEP_0194375358 /NCGR_PEP_ID=MMETSP0174-20130528/23843_1 /TAXON_ID=216777 /ORGANISM="Proboscia alata, Strain PI-D3" /LENGTH=1034 /DNA_ID=CAMNT_0039155487 /DNA_START=69 /DNA_END=3173 /DNA_ORIENTATION=-
MKVNNVSLAVIAVASKLSSSVANSTPLLLSVDGVTLSLDDAQVQYHKNQNHNGANEVAVSGNGLSAEMVGNLWRAFPLPEEGIEVDENTVLEFKFDLEEEADYQMICLDEDTMAKSARCFVLASRTGEPFNEKYYYPPQYATPENSSVDFKIPIGRFYTGNMKYFAFVQENDLDTSKGLSTISNIRMFSEEPNNLVLTQNGEEILIPDVQTYLYLNKAAGDKDSKQTFMYIADDGKSIQLGGNSWKALEFPSPIVISPKTVLEFDFNLIESSNGEAICFEEDRQITNDQKRCFFLHSTATSNFDVLLGAENASEGETKHYTIPIGLYYTGSFQYLAFISFSSVKSRGKSTFSNLQLYDDDQGPGLKIIVDGEEVSISETEGSYGNNQDSIENVLEISGDGLAAHLEGNQWKSVALPMPIEINAATEVEFDFFLGERVDHHGICFDDNLVENDAKHCFVTANTDNWSQHNLSPKTSTGETRHYKIPIGTYFTGPMNFIAFVQDNDSGDQSEGVSTYSNIVFSERPELNLGITQESVRQGLSVFNQQLRYADNQNQDTASNLIEVSSDGKSATLRGNLYKALEIPGGLTIGDNSVLSFDFLLEEITEIHGICIDENLQHTSDFPRCFPLAGTQDASKEGDLLYRGTEQTYSINEVQKYVIRLSEFFHGEDFKYLAFIQDNDSSDRTTGVSTYSNIEFTEIAQSCLKDENFEFSFDECTIENFVEEVEDLMTATSGCVGNNAWLELLAFFNVNSKPQIEERIGAVCTSGYKKDYVPFDSIAGKHVQFSNEFFDGGTAWNYEHASNVDVNRIEIMNAKYSNKAIGMPDVHNFKQCELGAAMCCYVANRKSNDVDADPEDNSDACYMDFSEAQESSHVRDGYSIYGNGVEGSLNCHGFAWGNDVGYADNAFKGNSLFQVAMYDSLYQNGFSEELPGAPMCGCVEQMPVVTKASCTKVVVDQIVSVKYDAITEFNVNVDIRSIIHRRCDNNDLSSHYEGLLRQGKVTQRAKDHLDTRLVGEGNCPDAIRTFLAGKGFSFS